MSEIKSKKVLEYIEVNEDIGFTKYSAADLELVAVYAESDGIR